jgi:DNA-binding Xre family transcriptional regulator
MTKSNDENFVAYAPLSRHPASERGGLREKYLRSNAIAVEMEDHDISARELARIVRLSEDEVDLIIRGHVKTTSLETLDKIEKAIKTVLSDRPTVAFS